MANTVIVIIFYISCGISYSSIVFRDDIEHDLA